MKTIITTLALLLSVTLTNAQDKVTTTISGTTITVTVPVKTDKGMIMGGLYNETTFMKAAPLKSSKSEIKEGIATLTFENVEEGIYGITLFHDTNGNNKMDFEANGMPKEMYGVSNNIMNFGPPQWSDAKFKVGNEPVALEIRL